MNSITYLFLLRITMKHILVIILFFCTSSISTSIAQTKPSFHKQDFPSHGDTIFFKKAHLVAIPNLIGMKYLSAQKLLKKKRLGLGATIYTLEGGSRNLEDQVVYKQNPQAKNAKGIQNYVKKRQGIDIWIVGINPTADTLKKIRIRTTDIVNPQ